MTELRQLMDINIAGHEGLISPKEIKKLLPATEKSLDTVLRSRKAVEEILDGKDSRLLVVVGPCSIHDPKGAIEYAEKLKKLSDAVADRLFLLMRVYFEKPRTTVGWKGLINDPFMDDSFHMEEGLKLARKLLLQFNEMGLPAGSEALDPITPQYLAELISWAAIGARTTESQTHRELASGLSMPIGFKNGTDGSIQVALNAMKSSLRPHHFLGINQEGKTAKYATRGNRYGHIVLRGGGEKTNYDAKSIATCEEALVKEGLRRKIVVDCSHGNSNKDPTRQPQVMADCMKQIEEGNRSICGFMIESNLLGGNQEIPSDRSLLKYGVSVTDGCLDWESTEKMIRDAHKRLSKLNF